MHARATLSCVTSVTFSSTPCRQTNHEHPIDLTYPGLMDQRNLTCACGRGVDLREGQMTRTREETERGRVHWIVRVGEKFHHLCDPPA